MAMSALSVVANACLARLFGWWILAIRFVSMPIDRRYLPHNTIIIGVTVALAPWLGTAIVCAGAVLVEPALRGALSRRLPRRPTQSPAQRPDGSSAAVPAAA